jgi:hypothetical protein
LLLHHAECIFGARRAVHHITGILQDKVHQQTEVFVVFYEEYPRSIGAPPAFLGHCHRPFLAALMLHLADI